MATKTTLGKLERVDLRDCWEREDTDFTPWLASEENIAILGEAIGMELEVQREEAAVGPFRADILCRDTASDAQVIIENQLDRTDHSHLGQTLTYAAGLDAVTLVWIAARFTEEHRAALDWLNRISHEEFRFFGVEIELWRIGNSVPAPRFNIIAKPNDWSKTVRDTARGNMSETDKVHSQFWQAFGRYMDDNGARFKAPPPSTVHWGSWGLGRTGGSLEAWSTLHRVEVRVALDSVKHPTWFAKLHEDRELIEAELGFALDWKEKPGKKHSSIQVCKEADLKAPDSWPESFAWMLEHMAAIDRVFRPRIKALDDSPIPEAMEEDDGE